MNTFQTIRLAGLLVAGCTLAFFLSTPVLAQDRGNPEFVTLVNFGTFVPGSFTEGHTGTPVDLSSLTLGDVLQRGVEITLQGEKPVELVIGAGLMKGGKIVAQQQSKPLLVRPGTYKALALSEISLCCEELDVRPGTSKPLSEAETSYSAVSDNESAFLKWQGDSSEEHGAGTKPTVYNVELPDAKLTVPGMENGLLGDPKTSLPIEPFILDYGTSLETRGTGDEAPKLITEDLGEKIWDASHGAIKKDEYALVLVVAPTRAYAGGRFALGPAILPFEIQER